MVHTLTIFLTSCFSVMIGVTFPDKKEAAFANLHMFQALGFTISYLYSYAICQDTKLHIVAAMLVVTMATVTIVEWRKRRNRRNNI